MRPDNKRRPRKRTLIARKELDLRFHIRTGRVKEVVQVSGRIRLILSDVRVMAIETSERGPRCSLPRLNIAETERPLAH